MTENPELLHEVPRTWRLSPKTRALGLQGVARARAALTEAARRREATLAATHGASAAENGTRAATAARPRRGHRPAA